MVRVELHNNNHNQKRDNMAEEKKLTGEQSMFDYIKDLEKLNLTNKKVKSIQERLISNLDIMLHPLTTIMNRIKDDGNKIRTHWDEYGDNYSSLPILHSTVPRYEESFGEFIGLSFKEKLILIDAMKKLFELADREEPIIEVVPENEEIVVEPEKKKEKKKKIIVQPEELPPIKIEKQKKKK